MNLYSSSTLFLGTLNQYSGRIFFFPYDIRGVDRGMGLSNGFPIRRRRYRGGSSQERAGRGISSTSRQKCQIVESSRSKKVDPSENVSPHFRRGSFYVFCSSISCRLWLNFMHRTHANLPMESSP
jgi:hypothetical protein